MAKQKRKSNKPLYYIAGGIVVLILVLVAAKSAGLIGKAKETEVELAKAKRASITEKVSASGTVQPVTEVKLSPDVAGEIIDLLVEEGDSVSRGQLLVKIRPDNWESQLERMEALLNQQKANLESSKSAYSRAQATFTRAQQEYLRQEKLWNEKVISEADWQLATQNYSVTKNDLDAAAQSVEAAKYNIKSTEAQVREARENVRRTSVAAPMEGIVSKLSVKKGERVVGTAQMAGTEMLRIADLNLMEVRVNVNENDIVRVGLGDSVLIDVDAYSATDKEFKGVVTLIANTAKEKLSADAITEFEVRILILTTSYQDLVAAGNKYPFRPGMTASVEIITTRKDNVLTVPLASVTTRSPDEGQDSQEGDPPAASTSQSSGAKPAKKADKIVVFVNEGGMAKMIEVKTGISDYDNIEILTGISDSTEVVTGPFLIVSKRLKDGDKIKKLEKKEEAKKPDEE